MPNLNAFKLRPGYIVALKTSIRGGVSYTKEDMGQGNRPDGALTQLWSTLKVTYDPQEYDRAKVTRSKCTSLIRSACSVSTFGLLCPENKSADLADAIEMARKVAADFNSGASQTRVKVYVIAGRVVADDAEAIAAIKAEVKDLLSAMAQGVKSLDVKVIRDAANKARSIGAMLDPETEKRVASAIAVARGVARRIVKAGETAAATVEAIAFEEISTVRAGFLELGDSVEIDAPAEEGRTLDLEPTSDNDLVRAALLPDLAGANVEMSDWTISYGSTPVSKFKVE